MIWQVDAPLLLPDAESKHHKYEFMTSAITKNDEWPDHGLKLLLCSDGVIWKGSQMSHLLSKCTKVLEHSNPRISNYFSSPKLSNVSVNSGRNTPPAVNNHFSA